MSSVLFGQPNRSFNPLNHESHHEDNTAALAGPWLMFSSSLSVSTVCGLLLVVFLAFNIKNLPGMWHMRILNAFRFTTRTMRPPVVPTCSHIFQPLITSSSAQMLEIDFNFHKSNSSYFSDLDISRTHLVCTLFAPGVEVMRGGTQAYTGSKNPQFGLALGAVSCNFKREVAPYQQYEMWSKILAWDEKWIYIVTHFVRHGGTKPRSFTLHPDSKGSTSSTSKLSDAPVVDQDDATADHFHADQSIFATALSKCVFKSGRKTVSPETMFELSGLFPPKDQEDKRKRIESQRLDGLKVARTLAAQNQRELEAEFSSADGKVLARHTDGAGIVGVVSTLMQLAGLKRDQVL